MGLHLDAGLTQENFVSKQEPLPPSPVLLGWVGEGAPGHSLWTRSALMFLRPSVSPERLRAKGRQEKES